MSIEETLQPAFIIGSTLVDAAVFAAVLFGGLVWRSRRGAAVLGLELVGGAVLAAALVFIAKLAPLTALGLNLFGMINLAYVDLIVVPPATAAVLLIAASLRSRSENGRGLTLTRGTRIAAVLALGLIPVGVYASWIEPFRLQLETARAPVASARVGTQPIRVGVVADLQTSRITDYERSAVDRLMSLRPDVILLPGDLYQGSDRDFEANRDDLVELLGRLSAPGGVYYVYGDVDQWHYQLESDLRTAGVVPLINQVVHLTLGDRRLAIGGVELDVTTRAARETIAALETEPGDEEIRLLVAHRPDVALGLRRDSRIDLVVAGHTHGGQIVVPGFGPPMTLSRVPRKVAAGGLHTLSGNRLYVSRGVGCERGQAPRIRFLCPPEISLLELAGDGSR